MISSSSYSSHTHTHSTKSSFIQTYIQNLHVGKNYTICIRTVSNASPLQTPLPHTQLKQTRYDTTHRCICRIYLTDWCLVSKYSNTGKKVRAQIRDLMRSYYISQTLKCDWDEQEVVWGGVEEIPRNVYLYLVCA